MVCHQSEHSSWDPASSLFLLRSKSRPNGRQLTFKQVTQEISDVTGRDIAFTAITLDEYEKMLREYEVPEDIIWLISYLFTEVLLIEKNSIVTHDIQKVLGRKAKDFAEYARETASTGIWNPVK